MLQISDVMDGDKITAVEFTDGKDTWFYVIGHSHLPSLQIGKFPCRTLGEEYPRRFRIKYGDDQAATQEIIAKPPLGEIPPPAPPKRGFGSGSQSYEEISAQIGRLVTKKQAAYGDSFGKSGEVLWILYPDGIKPYQYDDALAVVQIIDKLFKDKTLNTKP